MRIQQLDIENFRSVQKETLKCDPLTVLVGANGAGKSNMLHALRVFYDVNARLGEEDFFGRDTKATIAIRVVYGELRPDELKEFAAYIVNDTLTVAKRIVWGDGKVEQKYFAAALQIPKFAPLRTAGKADQISGWNALIDDKTLPAATPRAKRGDDVLGMMADHESKNPNLRTPVEREEQFFGPKNVGGGKLDNYTKFVYLPAVRDVLDDLSQGKANTLSQLLDTLVMRKLNARPEVAAFKKDFHAKLKEIYEASKTTDLAPLSKDITETLQEYLPNSSFSLTFSDPLLPEVPTPNAIPSIDEDGYAGDVARKGHGLQRVLIFTLLQHLALLRKEDPKPLPVAGAAGPAVVPAPIVQAGPDLILAIEEPELYQHPQRCRYLAKILLELAADPSRGLGESNQVIYTTHSPYFVGLDRFMNIRLARKQKHAKDAVPRTVLSSYTLDEAARTLAAVVDGDPRAFTAATFHARTYPIMTLAVSEGFFANAIVLVEGLTETAVLWAVAEQVRSEWVRKGVTVAPVIGKANLDRPAVVFRGLGIPTFVLFDGDVRHKGRREEEASKRQNQCCLRLVGAAKPVDFPPTTVEASWACFEDCVETQMELDLGKAEFERIRDTVAAKLGYAKPSEALKNYEVASAFVDAVYAGGKRLLKIEEIVTRVAALVP
jgi:hypothetical protein